MSKNIVEPSRKIPVRDQVDVLVVGGGPAGMIAAVAAARSGAKTLLVERHGFLGGNLTAAGVTNIRTFNDKSGRLIIKGIPYEFVEFLRKHGATQSDAVHEPQVRHVVEVTKFVAQEFVLAAGVKLLLHAFAVDVIMSKNKIKGLIIESKSGREAIFANVIIDASGDGDVAARSGAEFAKGSNTDKKSIQPMTLVFFMGGGKKKPWPWKKTPENLKRILAEAYAAGRYPARKRPGGLFPMWRPGEFFCNLTRFPGDATDVQDLTNAEIDCRRQVDALIKFYRKEIPDFQDVFIQATASVIGARETRRIIGEYTLTKDDVIGARDFEDNIARGAYSIDIHKPGNEKAFCVDFEPGKSYGIPYRCLLPKKIDNLLVAGRCISATPAA